MNIPCLILQIVSGIAASYLVGGAAKHFHLGMLGNALVGALGGALGGQFFLRLTGVESDFHSSDAQIFLTDVFGGAAGGAFVTFVAGTIRRLMSKHS
jgi:hypothetical protein